MQNFIFRLEGMRFFGNLSADRKVILKRILWK